MAEMLVGGSFLMDILSKKEYDKYKIFADFFLTCIGEWLHKIHIQLLT